VSVCVASGCSTNLFRLRRGKLGLFEKGYMHTYPILSYNNIYGRFIYTSDVGLAFWLCNAISEEKFHIFSNGHSQGILKGEV
jgi:hypothetical protein